jgi:hypothetical protein
VEARGILRFDKIQIELRLALEVLRLAEIRVGFVGGFGSLEVVNQIYQSVRPWRDYAFLGAGLDCFHTGFHLAGLSRSSTSANYLTTKSSAGGISSWTNHYKGPSDFDDIAHDIAVGDNGNVYVTGLSSDWSSGLDFATVADADYVRYTPPPDYIGTDSFSFTAVDHPGNTGNGVVTIVVLAALPIDTAITLQDASLLLSWSGGLSPYQVQMTTNLASPVWVSVGNSISGNSLCLPPTNNAAFYRILGQ